MTLKRLFRPKTKDDRLGVGALNEKEVGSYEYSPYISDYVTILLGVILLAASVIGCWTVEKLGRRYVLIGGLCGTAVSNLCGVIFQELTWRNRNVFNVLSVTAFCCVKLFIGLGAGAPAWFLTSELVPSSGRGLCQSISTGVLLILTGVITAIYLPLDNTIGSYALLALGTVPSLVCAALLFVYLPETKNIQNNEDLMEILDNIRPKICTNLCKIEKSVGENLIQSSGSLNSYGSFRDEEREIVTEN